MEQITHHNSQLLSDCCGGWLKVGVHASRTDPMDDANCCDDSGAWEYADACACTITSTTCVGDSDA